jgi:hypothetical protein
MLRKKITRRGVQIVLGVLWLLDGALQLQHQMFSNAFANDVIGPAAQGQPVIISGPMHFGMHIILMHPAVFDACFALIQLGIGVSILLKRTTKYGLYASVIWGLAVWFNGEGLAGMASGHATLLMGAPGAALIYALLSLAVLPSERSRNKQDDHPAYWLALVWLVLWIGGAIFQIMPGQDSIKDVSGMIAGMANGAPGWLASIDDHAVNFINGFGVSVKSIASSTASQAAQMPAQSMPGMHMTAVPVVVQSDTGYWFILILALVQLCIGIGVLYRGCWRKTAICAGIVLSLAFWIIGQSLGSYYTGLATDPNSGPLFVLLGIAILGCVQLDDSLSRLSKRIEYALVGTSH